VADDEARPAQLIEVRPGYFRASWPMAAAAVILDEADRILLVQPAYYPGRWLMPGGAEPADSPRRACERAPRERACASGRKRLEGLRCKV
jgi:8-oxo-dGTP pyrophosphatase MutT (NUDIX family)